MKRPQLTKVKQFAKKIKRKKEALQKLAIKRFKKDSETKNVRLFIALPLSKKIQKQAYEKNTEITKIIDGKTNKVEQKNLHITLAFLGDTLKENVQDVKDKMDVLKDFGEYEATIQKVGFFPNEDYIKVIWLGVENDQGKTKEIHERLTESFDLKDDYKPFNPHVTLSRVKLLKNKEEFKNKITELKQTEIGKIKVKEVILYKSNLTHEGPEYERIYSVRL